MDENRMPPAYNPPPGKVNPSFHKKAFIDKWIPNFIKKACMLGKRAKEARQQKDNPMMHWTTTKWTTTK